MDKIKKICVRPICYAVLLNMVFLLLSLFVFHPQFEENDDAFLAMIAEGAYGARDFHLIYANVCLGKILNVLYAVIPAVRWYSILQYLFLFAAFCTITWILCRYKGGRVLSLIFLFSMFYESYVLLQYTKTAVILAMAGYLLLFEVIREKRQTGKLRTGLLLIADILLIYGSLLRISAFLLASVPMLLLGLYELYKLYKQNGRIGYLKKLVLYVEVFAPMLCMILLFAVADGRSYHSDSKWNAFMTYNDTRMDLLDYRYDLLDYSAHAEQLRELGISENDALLYLTWQFSDDRVLSTDFMKQILDAGEKRALDVSMLKAFVSHLFEELYVLGAFIPGLICVLALLFLYGKRERDFYLYALCNLCILLLVLLYYQYSGRWNHRVVYGFLMVLLTAFLYEGLPLMEEQSLHQPGIVLALLMFFNFGLLLQNQFAYQSYLREEPNTAAQIASMQEEKDTLFVTDTFTFQRAYQYAVFTPSQMGSMNNTVSVGSWFVNSPITKAITASYGYENPFAALEAGAENVVLLDNCYPQEKVKYLTEHTNRSYTAEFLETRNGYDSYRIEVKEHD